MGRRFDWGPTVADRYDHRANGITALRFGLAMTVLVMHAWPLGGFGQDPAQIVTGGRLDGGGTLAVLGFFGLSGFLLAESRQRTSRPAFMWRRALRILPGYWICVVLTAAAVGWWYLGRSALPVPGVEGATWSGFATNPMVGVNGSLWTLPPEIACYLVLACAPAAALGLVAPLAAVGVVLIGVAPGSTYALAHPLVVAFFVGVMLSIWRAHVPLSGLLAGALLLVAYLTIGTVAGAFITAVALAYASLWLAVRIRARWTVDTSYGVYIYAFPITQALVLLGVARFGPIPLALTSAAVVVPVALASWYLVERPALSLKDAPWAWRRTDASPALHEERAT